MTYCIGVKFCARLITQVYSELTSGEIAGYPFYVHLIMEVKNSQAAMLCNQEVLSLINEMELTGKKTYQEASQLATILYETSGHLKKLPCKNQTPEKIEQLLTLLKDFPIRLTKLEELMICNDPPETVLQLCLIVKDCDEKLPETDIKAWVQKIKELMAC